MDRAARREHARRSDGRFGPHPRAVPSELPPEAEEWIPADLPESLRELAFTTDLIRSLCDALPECGKGACLPASAIVGFRCNEQALSARLVRGFYNEEPHWWIEAHGFIFDATAGQWGPTAPSVLNAAQSRYRTAETFVTGHTSIELLTAESERAFADPLEARMFVAMAIDETADAAALARRSGHR